MLSQHSAELGTQHYFYVNNRLENDLDYTKNHQSRKDMVNLINDTRRFRQDYKQYIWKCTLCFSRKNFSELFYFNMIYEIQHRLLDYLRRWVLQPITSQYMKSLAPWGIWENSQYFSLSLLIHSFLEYTLPSDIFNKSWSFGIA